MGIYPGHVPMNLARLLEHKHIITRQCFENLSEYLSVSLNITIEDCSIKQNIFFLQQPTHLHFRLQHQRKSAR